MNAGLAPNPSTVARLAYERGVSPLFCVIVDDEGDFRIRIERISCLPLWFRCQSVSANRSPSVSVSRSPSDFAIGSSTESATTARLPPSTEPTRLATNRTEAAGETASSTKSPRSLVPATDYRSSTRRVMTDGGTVKGADQRYNRTHERIDEIESAIDDVIEEIDGLDAETVDVLRDAVDALASDVASLEADLDAGSIGPTIERDLESLASEVGRLAIDLEEMRALMVDRSDLQAAMADMASADRVLDLEEAFQMIARVVDNVERTVTDRLERLDASDRRISDDDLATFEERVRAHFEAVYSKLGALDSALTEVDESVERIPTLEESIEETTQSVETVREKLAEERTTRRSSLERLGEDVDTLDARLATVDARVEAIDDAVDERPVAALVEALSDLEATVETLERKAATTEAVTALRVEIDRIRHRHETTGAGELESLVADLQTDVDATDRRLDSMATSIESLETTMTSEIDAETAIEDLDSRIDRINGKVESDLKTLYMELSDLDDRLDDERTILGRMISDDVFGMMALGLLTISAAGASIAFVDGRYAVAAAMAAVPVVIGLLGHHRSRRRHHDQGAKFNG